MFAKESIPSSCEQKSYFHSFRLDTELEVSAVLEQGLETMPFLLVPVKSLRVLGPAAVAAC